MFPNAVCSVRSMVFTRDGFYNYSSYDTAWVPAHKRRRVPLCVKPCHGIPKSWGEWDSRGNWWPRTQRLSVNQKKGGQKESSVPGRGLVCGEGIREGNPEQP